MALKELYYNLSVLVPLWQQIKFSHEVTKAQRRGMNYKRLGFLVNFNVPFIKNGIKRIILFGVLVPLWLFKNPEGRQ